MTENASPIDTLAATDRHLETAAVQFKLATLWQAKGQIERAIAGYEAAIRLRPDYIPAHLELGQLLTQQGQADAALAIYRRAADLNPTEACFQQKLAELTPRPDTAPATSILTPEATATDRRHVVVYTDCSGIYGAEQFNTFVMLHLVEAGYRVTCVQAQASHHLIERRTQAGIAHVWLAPDNLYDLTRPAASLTDTTEPQRILSDLRPDLLLFSDGAPMSSLGAKQAARRLEFPYVIITHCVAPEWAAQYAPYLAQLPALYHAAQAVVAVSQANLRLLHERFGLPADMGQVIETGGPPPFFAPPNAAARQRIRTASGILADALVVCTVGSMERRKGYQYLLQAIRRLRETDLWPQLYFIWVGTGSLEPQLRAVVEQLDAQDHVKFLGERSDVVDILDAADIFALMSQYEGMPLSIVEAMARGKAVVATAVSGIPEELGETGQLVPNPVEDAAGAVAGLVATLLTWGADATLREAVGQACHQRAAALFTQARMVAAYRRVVEQCLGPRPRLES